MPIHYNGLLREYHPKKTDFSKIEVIDLIKNIRKLNNIFRNI